MKEHLQLHTPCILGHKLKRPILSVRSETSLTGWTSVAKARLILCDFLEIDRSTLNTATHCCHACNDKRCINPLHLYFGTAYDNQQDVPLEIRRVAARYDRGKLFIAIDPKGFRYISNTFNGLTDMLQISSSTFHKYAKTERKVTTTYGQSHTPWEGWRFMRRTAVAA